MPARKRIIVHVGLPKCGSTALQIAFFENRDALLSRGVLYPDPTRIVGPSGRIDPRIDHAVIGGELMASRGGREPRALQAIVSDFRASSAHTLVLSSESFVLRAHRKPKGALGDVFDGLDVHVVAFIRRRDEWLRSLYKQDVKNLQRTFAGTLELFERSRFAYVKLYRQHILYDNLIRVPQAFSASTYEIVDLDGTERDTVKVFERLVDLPLGEIAAAESTGTRGDAGRLDGPFLVNVSFGDVATLFVAATNRLRLDRSARLSVREALSARGTGGIADRVRILSPDLGRRWVDEDVAGRQRLREALGIALPSEPGPPEAVPGAEYRQWLRRSEYRAVLEHIAPALQPDARAALAQAGDPALLPDH